MKASNTSVRWAKVLSHCVKAHWFIQQVPFWWLSPTCSELIALGKLKGLKCYLKALCLLKFVI